jgi:predicted ABC-type sugar transport system permease subunit
VSRIALTLTAVLAISAGTAVVLAAGLHFDAVTGADDLGPTQLIGRQTALVQALVVAAASTALLALKAALTNRQAIGL